MELILRMELISFGNGVNPSDGVKKGLFLLIFH